MHNVLNEFTGNIIDQSHPYYEQSRLGWNRAKQKFPCMIVYCRNRQEVIDAIALSIRCKMSIRIRSGGHNYEAYSNGDNVIVIDVSGIKGIEVNEQSGTIKIGGGIKNKELYNYATSHGYIFPGGDCPEVGVAGYALGGGWNYMSRYFGMGSDNLSEVEIVNYRGQTLIANEHINQDLFWAMRGAGGGNFGVVTALTFKLPPKMDKVTYFEITAENLTYDEQKRILEYWQKGLTNLDNKFNISIALENYGNQIRLYGRGIYIGSPSKASSLLNCFIATNKIKVNIRGIPFRDVVNRVFSTVPESEKFDNIGIYVKQNLTPLEIDAILYCIQHKPKTASMISLTLFGMGGNLNTISSKETAFAHHDAKYFMAIRIIWENDCNQLVNEKWLYNVFKIATSITGSSSYIGNPYRYLANYETAYFGSNKNRLRNIKSKYDPYNIFTYDQGINI